MPVKPGLRGLKAMAETAVAISRAPWSRDEFVARLRAVGAERYHHLHPFHQRMHEGKLSRQQLRGWVANRFYYQKCLPVKDALIMAKLPDREMRRKWLQRIVNQDGRQGDEGGLEAWLRLGEAVGLNRQELLDETHVLPGVRFAVDAYVNFCRLQPWVLAVASSLTELFAPDIHARRIEVFPQHYPWVKPEGLAYFRSRLAQAPQDSEHALGLVLEHCRSREEQEAAVGALRFKCDVLWALLDAVERGYPD